MGRKRKLDQGLPKRLYLKSGSLYYVHATKPPKWECLGADLEVAKKRAAEYNGAVMADTMEYWLNEWLKFVDARVESGLLQPRTQSDYKKALVPLKAYFGSMSPTSIAAVHVSEYLQAGVDANRTIQANRDKAALSSCLSWMVAKTKAGIVHNVALDVKRNDEHKRRRYITDAEYAAVYNISSAPVKAFMEIMYRTLQRPSDILKWTKAHLIQEAGAKNLEFKQNKTGVDVKISVSAELKKAFEEMAAAREVESIYVISRRDGKPYTQAGISSMMRRHITASGIKDFAPYDIKAKGATDMYQEGVPIEEISALCGHHSITTTEKYIKQHLKKSVKPNSRKIAGVV